MSLRLWLLERYLPGPIRREALQQLVRMTADAFGVPPPLSPDVRDAAVVHTYALFTRAQVERVGADTPEAAAIRDRLYAGAREIGRSFRRRAGIRAPEEAVRALRLVYGAVGIDLCANLENGEVTVRRCAFADVYTPAVCRFVSAVDAGLFHGVSGQWGVAFIDRMTDGATVCRGHLTEVPAG